MVVHEKGYENVDGVYVYLKNIGMAKDKEIVLTTIKDFLQNWCNLQRFNYSINLLFKLIRSYAFHLYKKQTNIKLSVDD